MLLSLAVAAAVVAAVAAVVGPVTASFVGVFAAIALLSADDGPGLSKNFPLQFRLMAQLRTPILMFVVVPLSFCKWAYMALTIRARALLRTESFAGHAERVAPIVEQVKAWNAAGRPKKLRTQRPNWAQMSTKLASNKHECNLIRMTQLDHILAVDTEKMTITVEPSVTMGMATERLLPEGLALKVQVEMESITIGGCAMGFGMETNSHHVGLFQETVLAYEVVAPSGAVLKVTAETDPDMFYALPWSHGSLGMLTALTVQLVRVQPYVRVTYTPTYSAEELGQKMAAMAGKAETADFLEATLYSKDTAVIQTAVYCAAPASDEERALVNHINSFWKPFYYKHVETFLATGAAEEIIPVKHFYHRFTRSIFWEIEDMIPFSNHPLYRCLWGWLGAPEVSLLKLFQGPVIRRASVYAHCVQESIMPIGKLAEGAAKFDEWYGCYPLLAFPVRVYDRGERSGFLRPRKDALVAANAADAKAVPAYAVWVDLGAYGVPRAVKQGEVWDAKANIRQMEHWTREVGGWQATYTDLFCTRKEFRAMFDHTLYDKVRARLGCDDAFPEVFDKVKSEEGIVDLADEYAAEAKAEAEAEARGKKSYLSYVFGS